MIGVSTCDFCGCEDCETIGYPAFDEDDPTLETIHACATCAYDMGLDWPYEDGEDPEWEDDDIEDIANPPPGAAQWGWRNRQ
jgi:hypothetical protein